jgi:hypothetical protein
MSVVVYENMFVRVTALEEDLEVTTSFDDGELIWWRTRVLKSLRVDNDVVANGHWSKHFNHGLVSEVLVVSLNNLVNIVVIEVHKRVSFVYVVLLEVSIGVFTSCESLKAHLVLSKSSSLVSEKIVDLTKFVVQVWGVTFEWIVVFFVIAEHVLAHEPWLDVLDEL